MRILFISANPSSTDKKLDLGDELRRFQHGLQGHDVKVMLLPAAQPDDLNMAIETGIFDIVHFSGHARDDGILMRNAAGIEVPFKKEKLAKLFADENKRSGRKIPLVFLNACETKETAEAIDKTESCGMVIGTNAKLDDDAAKVMTQVFYKAIGNKNELKAAFDEATGILDKHLSGTNVYESFGTGQDENLLTGERSADLAVDIGGLPAWDKHFHVTHVQKQIDELTKQIRSNQLFLQYGTYVGVALLFYLVCVSWPIDLTSAFPLSGEEKEALIGKKSYAEWLKAAGTTMPLWIARFKQLFLLNGNEKLNMLKKLLEMVKSSDRMSDELKKKLHAIMEQSVRGANPE